MEGGSGKRWEGQERTRVVSYWLEVRSQPKGAVLIMPVYVQSCCHNDPNTCLSLPPPLSLCLLSSLLSLPSFCLEFSLCLFAWGVLCSSGAKRLCCVCAVFVVFLSPVSVNVLSFFFCLSSLCRYARLCLSESIHVDCIAPDIRFSGESPSQILRLFFLSST